MGRASRTKKERRQQSVTATAVIDKSKGGRPRKHVDVAAKQRAYRLRRKLAVPVDQGVLVLDEASSYDVDPWVARANHDRWLTRTAKVLGPEWLALQLDIEAEAMDYEGLES